MAHEGNADFFHIRHAYISANRGVFRMHRIHVHAGLECNYVLSGSARYQVGERTYDIHAHDLLVFDASQPHRKLDIEDVPSFLLGLELEPAQGPQALRTSLGDLRSLCPTCREKLGSLRHGVVFHDMQAVSPVLQNLLATYTGTKEPLLLRSLLIQFFYTIEHVLRSVPVPTKGDQVRMRYVELVKRWIDCRYAEIQSVDEVSSYLSLHSIYLERVFHQVTGSSIWQYLIATRLKAACDLLMHTSLSIAAVERAVGFRSRQSFVQCFRKAFGTSPSGYRKAHAPGA